MDNKSPATKIIKLNLVYLPIIIFFTSRDMAGTGVTKPFKLAPDTKKTDFFYLFFLAEKGFV